MGQLEDIPIIVERQTWVDPTAETMQQGVHGFYKLLGPVNRAIQDILNGTWLGHPLHPVLTDVPLGGWTVAMFLDWIWSRRKSKKINQAADVAISVGLVGAASAALAGFTDWQHLNGQNRRLGFFHACLNLAVTSLFGASLLMRKKGSRPTGKVLSSLGYGLLIASAYLGGDLVYRKKVGMNHAPLQQNLPHDFVDIMAAADLPENELRQVSVENTPVVIVRRGDNVYALANTCAHLGGPLAEGRLTDQITVICPWHGSEYKLESGKLVHGPSAFSEPCFEARILNGRVEVRAPKTVLE